MTDLVRTTLRLARNPDAGAPEGDPSRGYIIVASVDAEGRLDLARWRTERRKCVVQRFSPVAEERADGWLTHNGTHWSIRYDEEGEGPNEAIERLGDHRLAVGEYVTITDGQGRALVYRVYEVSAV